MLTAAALVTLLLLVTFDLDRPTRGVITVDAASGPACLDGVTTCSARALNHPRSGRFPGLIMCRVERIATE
jgi:hypothetical protein